MLVIRLPKDIAAIVYRYIFDDAYRPVLKEIRLTIVTDRGMHSTFYHDGGMIILDREWIGGDWVSRCGRTHDISIVRNFLDILRGGDHIVTGDVRLPKNY